MPKPWRSAMLLAAGLLLARGAGAVELPFTGTLEIGSPLVPVVVQASGVAQFDSSARRTWIPESVFSFAGTTFVGSTIVSRFELSGHNGPLTISSASTGAIARMALIGSFRAHLNVPPATVARVTLPLDVIGGGGLLRTLSTIFGTTSGSVVSARIHGNASWVTGNVAARGGTGALAVTSGSNQRTAGGAGRLQLVTPIVIHTAEGGVATGAPPGFARLTLDFAPEPSEALLLLASVAGIVVGQAFRRRAAAADGG